ncbi:MAG: hypothetical protein OXF24_03040 [Hyphomicrobiales bacterium]|nr:hypothetical protein [Hyphomicrobiales bacterium]MCY4048543.1 hypothetical protein [Hyphomicrobiales bacterium]MCY4053320.1 hypothetical protein [Hyphomicrobiales bacterium]
MELGKEKVETNTESEPLSREQLRQITSGHRGLKIVVLVQAVLIVALFALVAGTIAYRAALM